MVLLKKLVFIMLMLNLHSEVICNIVLVIARSIDEGKNSLEKTKTR
jgi:hypothetical protein